MTNATASRQLPRDVLMFGGAILLLLAILPFTDARVLWSRPLWSDELVTKYLVEMRSPLDMVRLMARGGEWNPPLLHLLLWPIAQIAGEASTTLLRTTSAMFVGLALVLLYAALRRRFDIAASAAAALAVASNTMVLAHAFEGRFYGPWLLFAAAHAWSLGLDGDRLRSRRRDLWQAVFAVCLTTIHWFGVISLGLICAGAIVAHGGRWRSAIRLVAPSIAGFVALALCLPLLFMQRSTAIDVQWVPPLSAGQMKAFARLYWIAAPTVLAAILLLRRGVGAKAGVASLGTRLKAAYSDPSLAGITALALIPVALVGISIVLQPTMVARYGIVTVLAWAPLVALGVESTSGVLRVAVIGFLAAIGAIALGQVTQSKHDYVSIVTPNVEAYQQAKRAGVPIVVQVFHMAYAVAGLERRNTPLRYLDLPDSTIRAMYPAEGLEPFRARARLERDLGRYHMPLFGFPIVATQAQLDSTSRFILLAGDLDLPSGYKDVNRWGGTLFPRHQVTRLTPLLSLFVRADSR